MAQEATCLTVPLGPELCHQLEILSLCQLMPKPFRTVVLFLLLKGETVWSIHRNENRE